MVKEAAPAGSGALLAVDVGNTNTVLGLYDGERLLHHWRLTTRRDATSDEMALSVEGLLNSSKTALRPRDVIVASVVPSLKFPMRQAFRQRLRPGAAVRRARSQDRHADPVRGPAGGRRGPHRQRRRGARGWADPASSWTSARRRRFDVVTARGEYSGGVIVPGIAISPRRCSSARPGSGASRSAGPSTSSARRRPRPSSRGLYFGYLSLVDGVIDRIAKEIGAKPRVIATGGLAELFGGGSERIEEVDPILTLTGLRLIYERNRGG